MAKAHRGEASSSSANHVLRVLRIAASESKHIRTLSGAYGGIRTHYVKARSLYCVGEKCPTSVHQTGSYWKGYAPIEWYDLHRQMWVPAVLEITESLELDFRGRFKRGQCWLLERLPQTGRTKTPITGLWIEDMSDRDLRPAFDITPVLRTLYHVESIALDQKNPTPDRVILEPSMGAPPPGVGERARQEEPASNEQWAQLRSVMKDAFKPPETNGRK